MNDYTEDDLEGLEGLDDCDVIIDNIINIEAKVIPTVMADLLGISRAAIYNDAAAGKFGSKQITEQTYKEAIRNLRGYLLKNNEYKMEKIKMEKEVQMAKIAAKGAKIDDDGNPDAGLIERQIIQRIRADRANEVKVWLLIAEKRRKLLLADELYKLYEPFIHLIKNAIIAISLDYPETRHKTDDLLNTLADFGRTLYDQAEEDTEQFVEAMLAKDINDNLLELAFIPKDVATINHNDV